MTNWTFNAQNQNTTLCLSGEILLFHACLLKSTPAISAGMRIKGKKGRGRGERKGTAPSPYPTKHHPYTRLCSLLSLKKVSLGGGVLSLKHKSREANEQSSAPGGKKKRRIPAPAPLFPCSRRQIFFGKLRAVQKETTHTVSRALNCWGQAGRQTHTRIYTHTRTHTHALSHKMAALTKISLCPESCL